MVILWGRSRGAPSLVVACFLLALANADCECGYISTVGNNSEQQLFTDLIETDFTRVGDMVANTDWRRQAFNLTSERARGQFGEAFVVENVKTNPSRDQNGLVAIGTDGRPSGIELVVKSQPVDSMVPVAEIDSSRMDILWGTFRVGMKLTDTPGTCAAFFWYWNDTQEIDMEFLSKDFNASNHSYPVNLVLQSRAAAEAGYNAQATGDFKKVYLPFDPSLEFHEYRIDFLPGRVLFYADGKVLAEMTSEAVPTHAGHLILQHWSNGNPLWSGGPPERDAVVTVSYVKAYFNSSTPTRRSDWASRCGDITVAGALCPIPSKGDARNPWFFSAMSNMTNNQTISSDSDRKSHAALGSLQGLLLGLPLFLAAQFVVGIW